MIRVTVIDDNIEICAHIESCLHQFELKYNQEIEVEPYTSSDAFLQAIQQNHEVYDLIFLDVELDQKSGIDLANYIRYEKKDELQQIVFISGKSSYSLSLHDVHPLDFLIKPFSEIDLERVMTRYLKISGRWTDSFFYQQGGDTIKIKVSEIWYFSVLNKEVMMHTNSGIVSFHGSLREIDKQLRKDSFLYIHHSYLVNPEYVKIFEYDQVTLYDDTVLPIGSSRRVDICKKRMEWQNARKGKRLI